jgi:erythromycin esterase
MQPGRNTPYNSGSLLFHQLRNRALPLRQDTDLKPLVDEISAARVVMLGEASHGSHEFYDWRRRISLELIRHHGFTAICVEGDWPPCWQLNRYIQGELLGTSQEVLRNFSRWPTWMWANTDIARLADELKEYNASAPDAKKAGFFGLDVYSLFESIDSVLNTLEKVDPLLARKARARYECFEPFRRDEHAYARSLLRLPEGCSAQVHENLRELLKARLGNLDLEVNARIIAEAEHYYRAMIFGEEDSWNVRDRHMLDTLEHVMEKQGPDSKVIVWAHNTHIGDYRATDMLAAGHINIGGLAREKWGKQAVRLVGFGTYRGQVTASHAWDGPIETLIIPPGRPGSIEDAFHDVAKALDENSFFVSLDSDEMREGPLKQVHGHRAIGVVYNPKHERYGNYVPTLLADRYDAFVFVDRTSALHPLQQKFHHKELPETWPNGF